MSTSPSSNNPSNKTSRNVFLGCFNLILGIILGAIVPNLMQSFVIVGFLLGALLIVISFISTQETAHYVDEENSNSPRRISVWRYLDAAWSDINFLIGLQIGVGGTYFLRMTILEAVAYLSLNEELVGSYTLPANTINFEALVLVLFLLTLGYVGLFLASSTLGVWTALSFRHISLAFILNFVCIGIISAIWASTIGSMFQYETVQTKNVQLEPIKVTTTTGDDTALTVFLLTSVPYILWFIFLTLAHRATLRPLRD